MQRTRINKLILLFLIMLGGLSSLSQSGMVKDNNNALIPLLENNELVGHASVDMLDKISKDSNSYRIQVFDEYLHNVGSTKMVVPSGCEFKKVSFNGKNIVVKFDGINEHDIRYYVFNQKADLVFDTLIRTNGTALFMKNDNTFINTPIKSIHQVGVLDYFHISGNNGKLSKVIFIGMANQVWTYEHPISNANLNFLYADENYVVNQVNLFMPNMGIDKISTSILVLDIRTGKVVFETKLFQNDSIAIYPVSAVMANHKIEVISSFTKRFNKYTRVKYGICTHQLDISGKVIQSHFNNLTQTFVNDSVAGSKGLFIKSFLYFHKACKLKNGNWLIAGEQLKQPEAKTGFFTARRQIFLKKSICLFEINPEAEIVRFHLEPNNEEEVYVSSHFARRPHQGGMLIESRNRLDVDYFIEDNDKSKDRISYVFTDIYAYKSRISLGSILYDGGHISVDRFDVPVFSAYTNVMVLPARFGNAYLFKYDKYYKLFDFDMIRFVH